MTESKKTTTNLDTLRNSYIDAYNLMICNLMDADAPIRVEAIENECLDQLLEIREDLINTMERERSLIRQMSDPAFKAYIGEGAAGAPCSWEY